MSHDPNRPADEPTRAGQRAGEEAEYEIDRLLDGETVPDPDEDATEAEVARATEFAEQLAMGLTTDRLPAAMAGETRALLETAIAVHATETPRRLDRARRNGIVEAALLAGLANRGHSGHESSDHAPRDHGDNTDIISIRRSRAMRALPWVSAAAAAAAAVFFFVARPQRPGETAGAPQESRTLATQLRSRPADALIGPIDRAAAGDASTRLDAIFADRISGYRELSFRPSRGLP